MGGLLFNNREYWVVSLSYVSGYPGREKTFYIIRFNKTWSKYTI